MQHAEAKGDLAGALDCFHRANSSRHIFRAVDPISPLRKMPPSRARQRAHFSGRAALAPTTQTATPTMRVTCSAHSRAQEARAFLRSALELSPTDLTVRELLRSGCSGGQSTGDADPEYYFDISLQHYREGRTRESISHRAQHSPAANYPELGITSAPLTRSSVVMRKPPPL